jgi:hypothetical protein
MQPLPDLICPHIVNSFPFDLYVLFWQLSHHTVLYVIPAEFRCETVTLLVKRIFFTCSLNPVMDKFLIARLCLKNFKFLNLLFCDVSVFPPYNFFIFIILLSNLLLLSEFTTSLEYSILLSNLYVKLFFFFYKIKKRTHVML